MARDNQLKVVLVPRISPPKEVAKIPTIITLDIETTFALAEIFHTGEQRVGIERVIEPSQISMIGYKYYNEKKPRIASARLLGYKGMLDEIWTVLDNAEIVVTFNGNSFDIPWIMGAFMEMGITPPSPFLSVDLYRASKRGRFMSHKLDYLCQIFGIGQKMKHEGAALWTAVREGDDKAWIKMEKYCMKDVEITENLLDYLGPWIKNWPNMSQWSGKHSCFRCDSENLIESGWHRTSITAYARLQCKDCGAWNRLTHNKNRLTTRSI